MTYSEIQNGEFGLDFKVVIKTVDFGEKQWRLMVCKLKLK